MEVPEGFSFHVLVPTTASDRSEYERYFGASRAARGNTSLDSSYPCGGTVFGGHVIGSCKIAQNDPGHSRIE
jgi:hypothetical protein